MSTDFIRTWLSHYYEGDTLIWLRLGFYLLSFGLVSLLFYKILKETLLQVIKRLVSKSKTQIDDILFEKKTFTWLLQLIPALLFYFTLNFVFVDFQESLQFLRNLTGAYMVFTFLMVIISILNSTRDLLKQNQFFKDKPVNSYIQVIKIFIYAFGIIGIISLLVGKSPIYLFSALGAVSAVLLLVFKDSILGFVASIQIAANDMLRVGDWITFTKYGADGDVLDISLASVLIKNFDLTITSVPTYAFISDSFKNWRGMQESEGRRIKRAFYIDKNSIQFLNENDIENLSKVTLLKPYLEQKQLELGTLASTDINGRRLTNIGTFRKYMELYLAQHPMLNQNLTSMVRQLEPNSEGLPLELYAFSKVKEWKAYEEIMSDIFDHTLAIIPYFGLRLFQKPSGKDFQAIIK
jgi:miniconductance mechanosensitive channel